jgi:hypothetical protein
MRKLKLSDILWRAANVHLVPKGIEPDWVPLVELGVDCSSMDQFAEFKQGETRQGARYLWLDFARLVAESEGV